MTQAVIFDIDGNLADATHRLHHIQNGSRNWDAFFAECVDDPVNEPIRDLADLVARSGHTVILVSGRSAVVREETKDWLGRHGVPYSELHMRPAGDCRPDTVVKSEILDLILADGHEIAFVVDDRPSVVAMWRERGLTCLQCRDWDEPKPTAPGLLTLMAGPSGAGKIHWLASDEAARSHVHPWHVVSSDQLRADLCGDFRDQTRNDDVFAAVHAVAKAWLAHGLSSRASTNLAAPAINGLTAS